MKIRKNILLIFPLVPSLLYFYLSSFEKKLYVTTGIFIFLILINRNFINQEKIQEKISNSRSQNYMYFIMFIFLIYTQNKYLNLETITWDVSSYLVASNEINQGFIPLETQWESKGPLTIYIYYLISLLVNSNYIFFKLINDLILFLTIVIFSKNIKQYEFKKGKIYFYASFLLISIFSIRWFISEYTEFYCLPLIAYANYLYVEDTKTKEKYIGLLFGISFLINQGSVLLFFPILIHTILKIQHTSGIIKTFFKYFQGFIIPNILFLIIYWEKGLLRTYLANFFDIPLGYIGERASSFYELRVFLREISGINIFLYFTLISIFIFFIINFFSQKDFKIFSILDLINLNVVFSLLYYFIAGHNFYHHFIYFLYFSLFLIIKVNQGFQKDLIYFLVFISCINSVIISSPNSFNNLSAISETYDNYPLKKLSIEIDNEFENKNYTILALDFVLVLHYLDKTNYSYIVHPTNHYQDYITDVLVDLGTIEENHVYKSISEKPDVIICNSKSIDAGGNVFSTDPENYGQEIIENKRGICDFNNFSNDYKQIDSSEYRTDPNLNYYYDPYKEMNIFIKINN
tara:strand:+ start:23715 stop:25439 length:1725 start_codon:yes stop_codon:yes gene_type:complete